MGKRKSYAQDLLILPFAGRTSAKTDPTADDVAEIVAHTIDLGHPGASPDVFPSLVHPGTPIPPKPARFVIWLTAK